MGTSKCSTRYVMRELSAHMEFSASNVMRGCAQRKERSGETDHEKDVDGIASLPGIKWIVVKYILF